MTTPEPIRVLRVAGTHAEVGERIGRACAEVIRAAVAFDDPPPEGRTLAEQLALAAEYRTVTVRALPWLVQELDGVAGGAGVDPLALFAASIEEIWSDPPPLHEESRAVARGCSDLVAVPPATADGHLLVAHTNDLPARAEPDLIAIEWDLPGEPLVFTVGVGPWISVGWNSAGLSLTGNELTPNDERVGVPRLLQVRDMLTKRTLDDAVAAALSPERASSYNNVLVHRDGGVVDVEGSATDAELLEPGAGGTLAHTNHYVGERMLAYEGDRVYAERSAVRYRRACALLAAAPPGSITLGRLRRMLADHDGAPDAICRHAASEGDDTKTVFWCTADVTDGRILFGRGNPCDSTEQEYAFPA